jgi:NAD(P)-dependent dehydrogenase (short-subunit alcohol dehydrogenase family)
VNAVAPGLTDTGAVAAAPEEYKETLVNTIQWGRIARPVEIARVVLFLASDESECITGETLLVDGGSLAGRYFLPLSGGEE